MRFLGVFVVEGVQETLDLLGDDFRIIPFPGMLRSTVLSTVRVGVRIRLHGQGLCLSSWFWCSCSLPCAFVCGYGVWARIALVSPFHLALCSLPRGQAHEAWHHGRYAQ